MCIVVCGLDDDFGIAFEPLAAEPLFKQCLSLRLLMMEII